MMCRTEDSPQSVSGSGCWRTPARFGTGLADVNANVGLFFAVGFQNRLGYGFSFALRAIA
jgi:hypothetical protein